MEPFGLFNLLKALLPNPQNAEEQTAPSTPPQTVSPTVKQEQPSVPTPAQTSANACLDFISRHDERAKHLRK